MNTEAVLSHLWDKAEAVGLEKGRAEAKAVDALLYAKIESLQSTVRSLELTIRDGKAENARLVERLSTITRNRDELHAEVDRLRLMTEWQAPGPAPRDGDYLHQYTGGYRMVYYAKGFSMDKWWLLLPERKEGA
jgi:FtsZ-binding cell division protein ZapB